MTRLSVNINKVATIRNARGGNNPNVVAVAKDCELFGAQGITVHPRPDERHITYQDALDLAAVVKTEYNIEGYPDARFLDIISKTQPAQATLVPDGPDVITSNSGWDTKVNFEFLKETILELKRTGCRVSLFIDPNNEKIEKAAEAGADRIELYTEPYAQQFEKDKVRAVAPYVKAATFASEIGLEVNAGHDLDLKNLNYFVKQVPNLKEVSIGHALVCDALYYGLENTIQMYLKEVGFY